MASGRCNDATADKLSRRALGMIESMFSRSHFSSRTRRLSKPICSESAPPPDDHAEPAFPKWVMSEELPCHRAHRRPPRPNAHPLALPLLQDQTTNDRTGGNVIWTLRCYLMARSFGSARTGADWREAAHLIPAHLNQPSWRSGVALTAHNCPS